MTISLVLLGTFLTTKAVPILSAVSLFLYMGAFELSLGPVVSDTRRHTLYHHERRASRKGSLSCVYFNFVYAIMFDGLA